MAGGTRASGRLGHGPGTIQATHQRHDQGGSIDVMGVDGTSGGMMGTDGSTTVPGTSGVMGIEAAMATTKANASADHGLGDGLGDMTPAISVPAMLPAAPSAP